MNRTTKSDVLAQLIKICKDKGITRIPQTCSAYQSDDDGLNELRFEFFQPKISDLLTLIEIIFAHFCEHHDPSIIIVPMDLDLHPDDDSFEIGISVIGEDELTIRGIWDMQTQIQEIRVFHPCPISDPDDGYGTWESLVA